MVFQNGDFRFFWPENIKFFAHIPYAWDSSLNTGIGINDVNTLWITSYLNFTALFSNLGLSWTLINLIFWIIPIILISFSSAFFLFKNVVNKNFAYSSIAGIIFSTNTYFLSIFLGGQIGVAFAYALIPLVFLLFYRLLNKPNLYSSVLFGSAFSAEVLFDPRFAILTVIILATYYISRFNFSFREIPYIAVIPSIIALLLHSFWLLPLLLFKSNIIPAGFDSALGVKFFSFAFFENSLSLLHPNWPENIFGKTYFMRPEFLVLPILAFTSLLFIKNNKTIKQYSNIIPFFAFLALLSAFFAKGTNEPFGGVFVWLFENISGFSLFRDPTKFYSLVALSYSILIPYSLLKFSELSKKRIFAKIIVTSFIIFWVFSLRLLPVADVFQIRKVPQSYVQLKDFIVDQNTFFRTLWIPSWQRYGYFSDINPAIGRGEIFKEASASGMIRGLIQDDALGKLQDLGIRYVIIPEDSEGEIFLEDRKYSEEEYLETLNDVRRLSYLKELPGFGKIKVFEVPDPKDRFWSPNNNLSIDYNFVNPTKYTFDVRNAVQGDIIVFSEGYDRYWVALNEDFKIQSSPRQISGQAKLGVLLNSLELPKDGDYTLEVYYEPQKWVNWGLMVSGITLVFTGWFIVKNYPEK